MRFSQDAVCADGVPSGPGPRRLAVALALIFVINPALDRAAPNTSWFVVRRARRG